MSNQHRGKPVAGAICVGAIALGLWPVMAIASPHPSSPVVEPAIQQSADVLANTPAIAALAAHLKKIGAKMYGAYWCPHCTRQKEMFGSASATIPYVECDPRGENPQPDQCQAAGVKGYPTWEIKGKRLVGVQSFEELAEASGYTGSRQF